jgi:hypothetical protein
MDDHELCRCRADIVPNEDRTRDIEALEELEHPPRLARHVEADALGSLGITVTHEIRDDYPKAGIEQMRRHGRPETPGRREAM